MVMFHPRHSVISFVPNLETLPHLFSISLVGEHMAQMGTFARIAPIAG